MSSYWSDAAVHNRAAGGAVLGLLFGSLCASCAVHNFLRTSRVSIEDALGIACVGATTGSILGFVWGAMIGASFPISLIVLCPSMIAVATNQ